MKQNIAIGLTTILMSCGGENKKTTANTIENEELTIKTAKFIETVETKTKRRHGCDFVVPQAIKMVSGAKVVTQSNMEMLLLKGTAITFTGSNNVILVTNGAAATVTGGGNFIYVEKGGAATISGVENNIYAPKKASIIDDGEGTLIMVCESIRLGSQNQSQDKTPEKSMDTNSGLEKAAATLTDLTNKAQELASQVIDDVIPFDENDYLIGSWTVDHARFNDRNLKTKGSINLYKNGNGIQNYSIIVDAITIPQIAVFKWKRKGDNIHVNADEESIWQLENTSKNKHQIVVDLGNGTVAKLYLVRKN